MNKARLKLDALAVESFATANKGYTDSLVTPGRGCVCDMPPCGCTGAPDCTNPTATQ